MAKTNAASMSNAKTASIALCTSGPNICQPLTIDRPIKPATSARISHTLGHIRSRNSIQTLRSILRSRA